MAAISLTPADLSPFAEIPEERAKAMIADAMALAARVAPCIVTSDFDYPEAGKAILRAAILRWHEAGTGALQSQQAGPFAQTMDTRTQRRGMFWPSEIEQLQGLCQGEETSGAFAVDTAAALTSAGHADICALNFGALYCSCGAVLTNALYPLFE